jgi:hypothetical protein
LAGNQLVQLVGQLMVLVTILLDGLKQDAQILPALRCAIR